MTLGDKIKQMRTQKGLTQAELGRLIGMDDSAIRKYENGRLSPSLETTKKNRKRIKRGSRMAFHA
ncbi:MAG: helix-turn-helix transcriptional regulator [Lachnospiraceae bacterium]|nr:helix-turn-helix transcriptional regulator [Lachnospiraceae bacterium]